MNFPIFQVGLYSHCLLQDYSLLQGHHEDSMRVEKATKQDEGIYTCICTWTHNDTAYNTSGSRRLVVPGERAFLVCF